MVPWLKLQRCSKVLANLVNLWFSRRYFGTLEIFSCLCVRSFLLLPSGEKNLLAFCFSDCLLSPHHNQHHSVVEGFRNSSQLWKQQLREKKEREGKERKGREWVLLLLLLSLKRLVTYWNHQAGSIGSEWTFFENLQATVWELWERAQRDLELSRRWSSGMNPQWSKLRRQTISWQTKLVWLQEGRGSK